MLFVGIQKLSSIIVHMNGPKSHLDEVKMGPHSEVRVKAHFKFTTDVQYEGCRQGVTSSDVAIEENPAYQSVDLAAAKP